MSNKYIEKRQEEINELYNNTTDIDLKNKLEVEFNELTCREIINDYLYYGYGLETFIDNDYECAKNITVDRLKELFKEERDYLGNMDI